MAAKKLASNTKELLAAYQASDDKLTACRAALDAAMAERTLTVKNIVTAMGPGPYEFGGKTVKAKKRDTKDENGVVTGTTWFFSTIGDEIIKLD